MKYYRANNRINLARIKHGAALAILGCPRRLRAPLDIQIYKRKTVATAKEMWEDFSLRLKRFIQKSVWDRHDADDILQDVFYKIHSHIHTLRDEDKLEIWLYQITRHAIIDYYRRHRKVKTESSDMLENGGQLTGVESLSLTHLTSRFLKNNSKK